MVNYVLSICRLFGHCLVINGEFSLYLMENASLLNGHEILFVHCVSRQSLILIPNGSWCVVITVFVGS